MKSKSFSEKKKLYFLSPVASWNNTTPTAEIVIRDITFTFQKIPSNYMIGWNFNCSSKLGWIGRTYSFLANLVGLAWPTVFSQSWSDGPDPHPSWVALLDFPLAHTQASPNQGSFSCNEIIVKGCLDKDFANLPDPGALVLAGRRPLGFPVGT